MDRRPSPVREEDAAYPATALTVKALPSEMRPREEFLRRGPRNVSDEVLLAILLRSGRRGRNVIELARDVLAACKGLGALSQTSYEELLARRILGLGPVKAMEVAAALELGRRAAGQAPQSEPPVVRDPASVARLVRPLAYGLRQEAFWALLVDTKNRLVGQPLEVTRGLLDASPVHPREVLGPALRHGAAAIVLAHNHPSGDATPSPEDLRVTRQLIEAARIMGLRVLDHVVIGREHTDNPGFVSLREHGLVPFETA